MGHILVLAIKFIVKIFSRLLIITGLKDAGEWMDDNPVIAFIIILVIIIGLIAIIKGKSRE